MVLTSSGCHQAIDLFEIINCIRNSQFLLFRIFLLLRPALKLPIRIGTPYIAITAFMKNLKVITIITVLLVTLSCTSLLAQRRNPGNTSSARAAYGFPTERYKTKKKKQKKQRKTKKNKAKPSQPAYRKKNPWVN